jgi:hypothetical protein
MLRHYDVHARSRSLIYWPKPSGRSPGLMAVLPAASDLAGTALPQVAIREGETFRVLY